MKLNKKIMLFTFAGASAVGAITPALVTVAYGNDKLNIPNHVYQSEDDLKFGIDNTTYVEVKENFQEELAKKLEKEGIEKDSPLWKQEMTALQSSLTTIDDFAAKQNCSYGQLTQSVINLARMNYNIPLRRTTNVKWSTITDMFAGTLNSVTLYMDHEHIPSTTQKTIINNATTKFNVMLSDLEKANYKECDPYGAMVEVRKEMLSFFDTLNTKIAKISASMKLNSFISKYNIIQNKSGLNFSQIKDSLIVGQPIENINQIVTFIDQDTGIEKPFEADRMIPGYTITPKFAGFQVDKEKNTFAINIDWTATANHYVNTNEASEAEGHLYDFSTFTDNIKIAENFKNTKQADNLDVCLRKIFKDTKIKTFNYKINETKEAESQNIIDTYFGQNGLSFLFSSSSDANAKLEPFYNQLIDKEYIYNVPSDLQSFVGSSTLKLNKNGIATMQDLADAGLQIIEIVGGAKQARYLSEIIETVKTKKPETYTLAEKFVANCNVYSLTNLGKATALVSPNGTTNEMNTVQNTFYVAYANQFNNSINVSNRDAVIEFVLRCLQTKEWTILPDTKQPGACVDYVTSEQYFFNLCQKYSAVKDMIDLYEYNKKELEPAIKSWEKQKAIVSCLIAIAAINAGMAIFYLVADLTIEYDPILLVLDCVGILISSAATGFGGWILKTIISDIIKPLKNLSNEYEKRFAPIVPILDKIKARINEDGNLLSLIKYDIKTGPQIIDKKDYDYKLKQYYQNPFNIYKELQLYYSNFKWSFVPGITTEEIKSLNEVINFFNTNFDKWTKEVYGSAVNFDGKSVNGKAKTILKCTTGLVVLTWFGLFWSIFLTVAHSYYGKKALVRGGCLNADLMWAVNEFINKFYKVTFALTLVELGLIIFDGIETIKLIFNKRAINKHINISTPTFDDFPESFDPEKAVK